MSALDWLTLAQNGNGGGMFGSLSPGSDTGSTMPSPWDAAAATGNQNNQNQGGGTDGSGASTGGLFDGLNINKGAALTQAQKLLSSPSSNSTQWMNTNGNQQKTNDGSQALLGMLGIRG